MARLRALLVLLTAVLAGAATAQHALVVDGREVGEARTDVVAGHAYAPAGALVTGLGATLAAPAGTAVAALSVGGHLLQIDVVDDPAGAARAGAVRRAGAPAGDLAAVRGDDALWLPVAPVVRALGAQVAFQPERGAVVVLTPRPELEDARIDDEGPGETLVLRLDAPAAWSRFENEALGLSELELPRARLARARTLRGDLLERVDLLPETDGARIRLDAPDATLRVVALPDGAGTELRVEAAPGEREDATARDEARLVVLDAGAAAGADARALAEAVADRLAGRGVRVRLTPAGAPLDERAARGGPADLFASFAEADLPPGEVRIWVLGETAAAEAALPVGARTAATALEAGVEDEVRRRILTGLAPDLEAGRRYGRTLATALFQSGGYRAGTVREAPIAVLAGAAGRGVLLEASAEDAADPRLAEAVATAIESALGGAR